MRRRSRDGAPSSAPSAPPASPLPLPPSSHSIPASVRRPTLLPAPPCGVPRPALCNECQHQYFGYSGIRGTELSLISSVQRCKAYAWSDIGQWQYRKRRDYREKGVSVFS